MSSRGAHHHAAAFVRRMRHTQEPGAANVGLDVDGREQAAEADEVVEVVDVVRVPVVLALRSAGRRTSRRASCTPPGSSPAPGRRCWPTRADSWCSTPLSNPVERCSSWCFRSGPGISALAMCRLLQRSFVSAASRTAVTYSSPLVSVMTLNSSAGGCALVSMRASNCENRSLRSSRLELRRRPASPRRTRTCWLHPRRPRCARRRIRPGAAPVASAC